MLIIIICSVVLGYGARYGKRGGFFARGVEGVEHSVGSVVLGYGARYGKRGGFFARGVEGVEHLHPRNFQGSPMSSLCF